MMLMFSTSAYGSIKYEPLAFVETRSFSLIHIFTVGRFSEYPIDFMFSFCLIIIVIFLLFE